MVWRLWAEGRGILQTLQNSIYNYFILITFLKKKINIQYLVFLYGMFEKTRPRAPISMYVLYMLLIYIYIYIFFF